MKSKIIKLLGDLEKMVKIMQVWGLCSEKKCNEPSLGEAIRNSIVSKLNILTNEENIEKKNAIVYVLGKLESK